MRVLLATRNRAKLAELRDLLAGGPLELALPEACGVAWTPPPEDGATFEANATVKARSLAAAGAAWALADDSGLEVDALAGGPGVRSARFAGPEATDEANVRRLLGDLGGRDDRGARFVCVLALAGPAGQLTLSRGAWDGSIARAPAGPHGFGYDPVFVPAGLAITAAQLRPSEKQARSHRAAAVRRLLELLPGELAR